MEAIQNKVISLLQGLSGRFPLMTFTYGYDDIVGQHIVEVVPTVWYESDEYMDAECDVQGSFIDAFPYESLLFTSGNPYIRVEDPLFVAKGKLALSSNLPFENAKEAVFVDSHLASPTVSINALLSSVYTKSAIVVRGQAAVSQAFGVTTIIVKESEVGEYNYAMAA